MARVHVAAWEETYRGLIDDQILDDPHALPNRERMWTTVLADDRYRAAVAEAAGRIVGIAMSAPDEPHHQLNVLYLLAAHHGSGAGDALLNAVIGPHEPATLWVADPNPRAQAFYRKHGFRPDGTRKVEDGAGAIRMSRCHSS